MTSSTPETSLPHDIRRLQLFAKLFLVGCLLAGAVHRPALAQAFPATTSDNTTTYGAGTYNGAAVAAGAAAVVAGGAVAVAQNKAIRTAAGVAVGVVAKALPAAGAVRGAVAYCLNNPACAVASAAAVAAVANELGYQYNVDPAGVPVVGKSDPSSACDYSPPAFNFTACGDWKPTPAFAKVTMKNGICYHVDQCDNNGAIYDSYNRELGPPNRPPTTTPVSVTDFAKEVADRPVVPPASQVPKVVEHAAKHGANVPLDAPSVTVTGPASVAKAPSTTTKADGTTITRTGSIDLKYYGPTVEATEKTIETTTTPTATGGTTTTTNTTVAPTTNITETPDACAGNPNSNGCRTDVFDTPAGEIPKSSKTIPFNVENVGFGAGQCPAPIRMNTSNGDYEINLAPYCDAMTNYVKPVLLLIAAFAAFAICVPKGADI